MATTTKDSALIELRRLEPTYTDIWIAGTAPLIQHKWSEKALCSMPGSPYANEVDKMKKKGLKNPEEEAGEAVYRLPDGQVGFPATAFKAAIVGACRLFDRPTMTEAKQIIYVEGETAGSDQLVRIYYKGDPFLREDVVRLSSRGTELRYRYQFENWWAKLRVFYIATSISPSSIVTLVEASGIGGVGEWRPSSPMSFTGTFGTYRVMNEEDKAAYGVK